MKNLFPVFLFSLSAVFSLCAEDVPVQLSVYQTTLLPQDVYVGDTAEIRCTLEGRPGLAAQKISVAGDSLFLKDMQDVYTVVSADFSPSGQGEYTLSVFFIPWQPGPVDLPPFLLPLPGGLYAAVDVPPVTVMSILEKVPSETIRAPAPPLVIPGTTYIVYGGIVGCVLLFSGVCVLLVKGRSLVRSVSARLFASFRLRRFLKCARRLGRSKLDDAEFCTAVCRCVREYLDARFMPVFSAASVPEIDRTLRSLEADEFDGDIGQLCAVCIRCDYIRFGRPENGLAEGERTDILSRLKKCVLRFENGIPEKKEKNGDGGYGEEAGVQV